MKTLMVNPRLPKGDAIQVDGEVYEKGEQYQFADKKAKEMLSLVWAFRRNLPIFVETEYSPPQEKPSRVTKKPADNAEETPDN